MRSTNGTHIPRYVHWGIAISIYQSQDRFSAQYAIEKHRFRVERKTEHQALRAAKTAIEETLKSDPALEFEENCAEKILARHDLSLLEGSRLIERLSKALEPTGATLTEVVNEFVKQTSGTGATVEQVITAYIRSKERDSGVHHVADLRSRLERRFAIDFAGQTINSITGPSLARWLDDLPVGSRSRRNYHSALVGLFRFAKERGHVADNLLTAPEKIRKPKAGRVTRQVFSPAELKALIATAFKLHHRCLLPLVIQCFAGVRSEELCQSDPRKSRLCWEDLLLDQDDPEIHVRADVAKTGEERFVFITPCLREWLQILRKTSSGPIYAGKYLWKDYAAISRAAGCPWKKNGPRKSFNTYHAALSGSLAATAAEAGNSEQMIRQYYRKTLSQASRTAREWFALGPDKFVLARNAPNSPPLSLRENQPLPST